MAAKKPAAKPPAMEQPAGNVIKNLTDQSLSIGGVTIAPGGESVIDNLDAVKNTPVIVAWLNAGVIAN